MALTLNPLTSKTRKLLALSLLAGLMGVRLSAAAVQFQVTPLPAASQPGSPAFRIDYFLVGFDFLANQALDIQFDPTLFTAISNGVAGSGFDLALFQPNNPPQAAGVYSALATLDHPVLSAVFRVDTVYIGPGTPGSQAYSVDQFDSQGNFKGSLASGSTVPAPTATPEPATAVFIALGLFTGFVARAFRKRQTQRKFHPSVSALLN